MQKVVAAYRQDQIDKNIRASGASGDAFRSEADFDSGKVFGKAYVYFQMNGRRPGGFPPLESIIQWIQDKGITPDIPIRSLAFLIARKIAKTGTDIYQRKRPALSIEDKIKGYREELAKNLLKGTTEEVIQKIRQT